MLKKDCLKVSKLFLKRRTKKIIIYSIALAICCILGLVSLTFNHNLDRLLSHYNHHPELNMIIAWPKMLEEQNKQVIYYDESIEEILSMNHTIDAFIGDYYSFVGEVTNLKNENVDGKITVNRATEKNHPEILYGRSFKDGETGVAICPVNFYPHSDESTINKKYVLNGKKLLGEKLEMTFDVSGSFNKDKKAKHIEKEFEVVGLYNPAPSGETIDTCYISAKDLIDIIDLWSPPSDRVQESDANIPMFSTSPLYVVVDELSNKESVEKEIEEHGFKVSKDGAEISWDEVLKTKLIIAGILAFSVIVSIFTTHSYLKMKLNEDNENIAVLKISGFTKKEISNIYSLETFIQNLEIYIAITILLLIFLIFAINYIPTITGFHYLIGGIKIGILPILITFIIYVILPTLKTRNIINKKYNTNTSLLINNKE